MHFTTRFLLLSFTLSFPLKAEIISTDLFTLEVPNQWHVEDNKTNIVLVTGGKVVDKIRLPFLSIQYCKYGDTSTPLETRRCDTPCSKKSLEFLLHDGNKDMQFSTIASKAKPKGAAEYSTEATLSKNGSSFATLSCTTQAQVYVSMVSDEARHIAKPAFEKIISSLKWK